MQRFVTALTLAGLCLMGVAGCNGSANSATEASSRAAPKSYPYRIVTTCGMVTDIVREIAGDHADVVGLMGEGVDPHLYKPVRNDVKQLLEADIVFYSGLSLEGRMTDTFTRIGRQGKPVFPVTEEIDPSYLLEPPEFEGHSDPHVWMDVAAWSQCVDFVSRALAEFDPTHAADYAQRATAYRAELERLHEYVQQVISTIPRAQRVLVTAHDAFGYFSRAYDIPVRAIQGITTESEPGVDDINSLVDFLVERKVRAIFVESSVSPKNMQAVMEGAAQKGWVVRIGGELYSDAMGRAGTYEGTYVGMIDHNATLIARALGGQAPERGLNGKLRLSAGD